MCPVYGYRVVVVSVEWGTATKLITQRKLVEFHAPINVANTCYSIL